ncbi:hypothetical protein DPMN_049523 [Dreissena polymorpha]|uniref:Uncharacterized protein n=1 Tax=Dreissena polymorpha TaxID=45954 RepID=A0A9D4HLD6_DREPO|nr:hypothetical protein DPMN_049523 [Dreissena polymorpha]
MHELSTEIRRIKTEGEGRALARAQEELAEVREVKDKVTQDLDKAKKVRERASVGSVGFGVCNLHVDVNCLLIRKEAIQVRPLK